VKIKLHAEDQSLSSFFLFSDQDELEAELEDLEEEELDEELPEPPVGLYVPVQQTPKETSSSKQASDLTELTKLQAEMAL
jgi:charged multivesicular body protein 4A/B